MTPLAIRCIVGMTILLLAAGLSSHLLRKRLSASQRHVIWTAAMMLSLLLPVLLQWTPPATTLVARGGVEVQRILITVTPDPLPAPTNWPRAIWLGGMAAMALWTLAGYLRAGKLLASSREFATVDGIAVRTAPELKTPAVALGPAILLPESAAEWPAERLDVVLTHELAHVRRWDLLWRLAGSAVCCVYWFHPLAWWAAAQQRRESEMSCDDQVLNTHGSADAYADSLVAVAREASGHATPRAVLAMAKPNELEGRLVAVLDAGRRRHGAGLLTVLTALALGLAAVSPLAAWQDPAGVQMKGSVRDIVGVIPGAKVILTLKTGGSPYSFDTGADGSYSVSGLPAGKYDVEVLKPGYKRFSLGVIEIGTKMHRLDHYIEIGSIRETITVDGGKAEQRAVSAATAEPTRLRVSGNVQAAKMVNQIRPVYPKEAKVAGIQGLVRMQAIVGIEGQILGLKLLSSPSPELARAAMDAVSQWKYSPTLLNGNPVEIQTVIDVNFTLAP